MQSTDHWHNPSKLILFLILSGCFNLVLAQTEPTNVFYPETAAEVVAAVELANADPQTPAVIVLDGTYTFDTVYEQTKGSGNASVLPTAQSTKLGFLFSPQTIVIDNSDRPSGVTSTFVISIDASMFLLGYDASESNPNFSGFDRIVEMENSTLGVAGMHAHCGEECVTGERSRAVVMDSGFNTEDDSISIRDPGAFNGDMRPEFRLPGLQPQPGINNFQQALKGINEALENFDVAIIRSRLESSGEAAVAVTTRDFAAPSARTLIDSSMLFSASSGSAALILQSTGDENRLRDSVIAAPDSRTDVVKLSYGGYDGYNTSLLGNQDGVRISDGQLSLGSSTISYSPQMKHQTANRHKAACDFTFGSDQLISLGNNIIADSSCAVDGPGDQIGVDPGLSLMDGVLQVADDSPTIDGGGFAVNEGTLPCSVTDINGLPRPQDGNGDGIAECDVGAMERSNGPDISATQSGAFFDVDRNGEGVFVEMLGGGKALVYLFSYTPSGNRPFWALGVGDVVGNGIVISRGDFLTTRGPSFGETFDPSAVERIPFADMSISFPNCANDTKRGTLAIDANAELGYPPLLSRTSRLTGVLSCATAQQSGPGYTGSFFDPTHDGEGIIVQATSPTDAVMIWFTYDAQGNQYWVIGSASISGNVITAVDAVSQSGPAYGPSYDASAVSQTVWGDFSLTFGADCNSAELSYESEIPGFGSGNQSMVRIAGVDGVSCGP